MNVPTVAQRLAERRHELRLAAFGYAPFAEQMTDATIAATTKDMHEQFAEHKAELAASGITHIDAEAINAAIRSLCSDLPLSTVLEAERRIRDVAEAIRGATPAPTTAARVVQVERRARRVHVVRLHAEAPLHYAPGQYVVTIDIFGARRCFFPAIPANDTGQVEFHIFGECTARLGDTWRISEGRGGFDLDPERDNLLIAHGTGFAALRPVMLAMFTQEQSKRTQLVVAAEYPGELYELASLWQIASAAPWLMVMPVVTHEEDAWWVRPTSHSNPPRGLHLTQVGQAGEVLASYGNWADRNILIAGPQADVQRTRAALIKVGAPAEQISSQDFTFRPFWR